MRKSIATFSAILLVLGTAVTAASAQGMSAFGYSVSRFDTFRARPYTPSPAIERARVHPRIDPKLVVASRLAEADAERRSKRLCWRYVKKALLKARAVNSYPKTVYAKQAARELTASHGFVRLPVRNPYHAPVGAVLVYGGNGAGHVEIRTRHGFVSDYRSYHPSSLPFLGAFAKSS